MTDIYYYDISKKGKDLLGSGDVPILINEQAVKESLYNLLLTETGTKVMDVTYGIRLDQYVFSDFDDFTAEMMQFDIRDGILRNETRLSDLEVIVTPDEENITYIITINFTVSFSNTPQTLEVSFNKIR